jgi:hypothetical protein
MLARSLQEQAGRAQSTPTCQALGDTTAVASLGLGGSLGQCGCGWLCGCAVAGQGLVDSFGDSLGVGLGDTCRQKVNSRTAAWGL